MVIRTGAKIRTQEELVKYLLYSEICSGGAYSDCKICVGVKGDEDISDVLTKKLQRELVYLLTGWKRVC